MHEEFMKELKDRCPGVKFKLISDYPVTILHDNHDTLTSDDFYSKLCLSINKHFDKEERSKVHIAFDTLGKVRKTKPKGGEYVLCYMDGNKAYFTNQPLHKQWGDDWDDAPYECNAGDPYEGEGTDIIKLYVDVESGIALPTDDWGAHYSVKEINSGEVPWIFYTAFKVLNGKYLSMTRAIFAGTTLEDFKRIILADKGEVYMKVDA